MLLVLIHNISEIIMNPWSSNCFCIFHTVRMGGWVAGWDGLPLGIAKVFVGESGIDSVQWTAHVLSNSFISSCLGLLATWMGMWIACRNWFYLSLLYDALTDLFLELDLILDDVQWRHLVWMLSVILLCMVIYRMSHVFLNARRSRRLGLSDAIWSCSWITCWYWRFGSLLQLYQSFLVIRSRLIIHCIQLEWGQRKTFDHTLPCCWSSSLCLVNTIRIICRSTSRLRYNGGFLFGSLLGQWPHWSLIV